MHIGSCSTRFARNLGNTARDRNGYRKGMYIVIAAFHINWSFHSDVKEHSCFSSPVPFPIRH